MFLCVFFQLTVRWLVHQRVSVWVHWLSSQKLARWRVGSLLDPPNYEKNGDKMLKYIVKGIHVLNFVLKNKISGSDCPFTCSSGIIFDMIVSHVSPTNVFYCCRSLKGICLSFVDLNIIPVVFNTLYSSFSVYSFTLFSAEGTSVLYWLSVLLFLADYFSLISFIFFVWFHIFFIAFSYL